MACYFYGLRVAAFGLRDKEARVSRALEGDGQWKTNRLNRFASSYLGF